MDTSEFPDFNDYAKTLERGLWVLWVTKEKLGIKRLNAGQIALILREVKETSVNAKTIVSAFNRAGDKIHTYREGNSTFFEVMKNGKDHLLSQTFGFIELFYFEPGKRFTSKRTLAKEILCSLKGELKIVDPYSDERTLDILREVEHSKVNFLTRLENLYQKRKDQFLRSLKDFKFECANIEFRNYPHSDIHDRYIISSESLVLLGHSIKDLGSKESFAVVMNKDACKNIAEALNESFDRRWKQSSVI